MLDDFSVRMSKHEHVVLSEWVPGGNDIIVDNFNDSGRIDCEPKGLLTGVVDSNREQWMQ